MVAIDLAAFFDSVNHDVLMHLVAQPVQGKRVLRLIGRYLRASVEVDGVKQPTPLEVPQGGSLPPLLANIVLHELLTPKTARRDGCTVGWFAYSRVTRSVVLDIHLRIRHIHRRRGDRCLLAQRSSAVDRRGRSLPDRRGNRPWRDGDPAKRHRVVGTAFFAPGRPPGTTAPRDCDRPTALRTRAALYNFRKHEHR